MKLGFKFSSGKIIEKEKGFCAATSDVVHTHCDQINTDRIKTCELLSEQKFRSHAVGSDRKIIEKEKGFCAATSDVVHTHCDQINTDRIKTCELLSEQKFRSHAVG